MSNIIKLYSILFFSNDSKLASENWHPINPNTTQSKKKRRDVCVCIQYIYINKKSGMVHT